MAKLNSVARPCNGNFSMSPTLTALLLLTDRYVMQYLAWRDLVGLHHTIIISFMTMGHTKFSPDWCFGLFKRAFRRTAVGSLDDAVGVAARSAEVN